MFLDPCKAIIIPRQTICRTQIPQIGTIQGKAQGGIFLPYQRTYRAFPNGMPSSQLCAKAGKTKSLPDAVTGQ